MEEEGRPGSTALEASEAPRVRTPLKESNSPLPNASPKPPTPKPATNPEAEKTAPPTDSAREDAKPLEEPPEAAPAQPEPGEGGAQPERGRAEEEEEEEDPVSAWKRSVEARRAASPEYMAEDIIDGFAIFSFRTKEDLQVRTPFRLFFMAQRWIGETVESFLKSVRYLWKRESRFLHPLSPLAFAYQRGRKALVLGAGWNFPQCVREVP